MKLPPYNPTHGRFSKNMKNMSYSLSNFKLLFYWTFNNKIIQHSITLLAHRFKHYETISMHPYSSRASQQYKYATIFIVVWEISTWQNKTQWNNLLSLIGNKIASKNICLCVFLEASCSLGLPHVIF
jgi:hypothetical protein